MRSIFGMNLTDYIKNVAVKKRIEAGESFSIKMKRACSVGLEM